MNSQRPLILITNDDGYASRGLQKLVALMRMLGDVVVISTDEVMSAKSHSCTIRDRLYVRLVKQEAGFEEYRCNGTPVDCVKLGYQKLTKRQPDLVVSGINHGMNAAPDAGIITCTYNVMNQLVSRSDANGNQTMYTYDLGGRTTQIVYSNGQQSETIIYIYDNASGAGIGQLASVKKNGSNDCVFAYDELGRLAIKEVYDDNTPYRHRYGYNFLGQLQYFTYPDGFCIKNVYNSYGELEQIRNDRDNSLIYSTDTRNKFRQPLKCRYGNGSGVQYSYNSYGLLTGIKNGDIVNGYNLNSIPPGDVNYSIDNRYRQLNYTYDNKGFIASRTDSKVNQTETYSYDNLDRLISYAINGVVAASFTYANSGNISTNSKVGTYSYSNNKPHAVTGIAGNIACPISASQCDVSYNLRNKPTCISENGYSITLDYDAAGMRRHTYFRQGNTNQKSKARISDVHEVELAPGLNRRLDYIYAEGQLVAVHVKHGSIDSLYYVMTDHLGSWNKVMDESKNIVQQTHFDPWGNRMSYTAWNTPQTQISFPFDRGFTGHEHYDRFKIINANARLYDPVIGRFFSPDPLVQVPDFSQSFNRYSYCLNNPVMYNDPDGEFFWAPVIVGAMVGAYFGAVRAGIQGGSAGDCMLGFAIGGLGGGLGGYVGQSVAGLLGTATTIGQAFTNGAIIGGSSSFTNSFIYTAGNSWIEGASFKQGLINGIVTGGSSALLGGITGGVLGSIQYQRQIFIFQRGCVELGVDGGGPVPATDQFLSDAQKAWYPDAPMKNVHDFTVERVPDNAFIGKGANAPGVTRYLKEVNVLTGMSDVYFNKDLAFSSAKQLFYTMGHEFVHVSQFAALAGQSASILTSDFMDMLDYYAYGYQNYLGGLQLNSFSKEDILRWSISYPQFDNMNYIKFPWCFNHSFIYPF